MLQVCIKICKDVYVCCNMQLFEIAFKVKLSTKRMRDSYMEIRSLNAAGDVCCVICLHLLQNGDTSSCPHHMFLLAAYEAVYIPDATLVQKTILGI